MKIDKVIFSVSEPPAYSSYWNIQSKLYKKALGIEPICLLFGKKSNTDMSEEYGKVIEREIIPDLPWVPQMTWSKFDYCRHEPDTTWMVGDIDLLPLSKHHFTTNIAHISDDDYAHLNAAGISAPRVGITDGFLKLGSECHGKAGGFIGSDLPGHYHVAKGRTFQKLYGQGMTFEETVRHIVDSDRYGMGVMCNYGKECKQTQSYWYYWLAEENYSSELLWNAIESKNIKYHGLTYHNELNRVWKWNKESQNYQYDPNLAKKGHYVDIHCCQVRPYGLQANALEQLLNYTGMLA